MELTEILKQLEIYNGVFPRLALEEAILQKEQITPELLKILREARQNIYTLIDNEDYFAHLYAIFLLAQFREKQAYPVIVDFFSIPGEISLDFTGDLVTEDLGRILASVCEGDVSLIERLIENPEANKYVRKSAQDALLALVANGVRTREEVMEYFQILFREKLERIPSHAWTGLVSCSTDLHPAEVMDDIKHAYEEGLVNEAYIDFKWINSRLKIEKETILQELKQNRHYRMVGNVIEEMQNWACFAPPSPPKEKRQIENNFKDLQNRISFAPAPKTSKKVGRNEPCPCGSGKKYKKCCGALN